MLVSVYNNNGVIGKQKKIEMLPFPFETLNDFEYEEDKGVAKLFSQINAPIRNKNIKPLSCAIVNKCLIANGNIEKQKIEKFTKEQNIVTEKGKELGLYNEVKEYYNRSYIMVIFNRNAQEFIIKNLEEIFNVETL